MDKRRRNYQLLIGPAMVNGIVVGDPTAVLIEPPFTMEFDIQRNNLASTNNGTIRIYNLSEDVRKKVYKDSFRYDIRKTIQLKAGYGDTIPTIFKGCIRQASSVRQGVNFITTAECFDAGDAMINGEINQTFMAGTPKDQIMRQIIQTLPGVSVGAVGQFPGTSLKAETYSGNSANILKTLTNDGFFVDLEKAYCLNNNECITGAIPVLNSASGLLGTPVREETKLTFDIIFEPRLQIGQLIELQSSTERNFNGQYKVISIKHRGTISDSVCGDAVTSVGLWYGTKSLTVVN